MSPTWKPAEWVPPIVRMTLQEPLRNARIVARLQRAAAASWRESAEQSIGVARAMMLHCKNVLWPGPGTQPGAAAGTEDAR